MSTVDTLSSANALLSVHSTLLTRVRTLQREHRNTLHSLLSPLNPLFQLPVLRTPSPSPPSPDSPNTSLNADNSSSSPYQTRTTLVVQSQQRTIRSDLPAAKKARTLRYQNYVPEEETIRNDYNQRYVDGGEWPQNWVIGAEMERRFEEYPKQQRLLSLKKTAVAEYALPPTYLSFYSSRTLLQNAKFDVILIDPPFSSSFTWEQVENLPVASLAADPSFIFLWVGSGAGEGLERGREILGKWGYRRCEDICWVRTNQESNKGPGTDPPTTSLLTRTKQHCLMGIRGTVRRSTDNWFVHCNIDTDVIIWEGDPDDPTRKPPEMYQLIENFCLGTRRLEIFGRYHSLRRGWVTVTSEELTLTPEEVKAKDDAVPFDREKWDAQLKELAQGGKFVVPNTPEIESLRPKSPTPRTGGSGNSSAVTSLPNPPNHSSLPQLQAPVFRMGAGGLATGNISSGTGHGYSNQMMARPMSMMNIGPMSVSNMGGHMNGMNGVNNLGNMGEMNGVVGNMNWQMGGGGINNGLAVGGPTMRNIGGMAMGNLPIAAMNPAFGTQGQANFGFGFENGSGGNAGMGMMVMGGGVHGVHQGMGMTGALGPQNGMTAGFGGRQGQIGFTPNQGMWMGGGDFNARMNAGQQFMGGAGIGGVWDGSDGIGMNQWGNRF